MSTGQRPAGPPLSVIRWEDPPEPVRPPGLARDCVGLMVQLAQRPYGWARVAATADPLEAASVAARLRSQTRAQTQVCVRTVDGEHRVYARWIRAVGR